MTSTPSLASQVRPGGYDAVVRIDLFTDVYDWNKGWEMGLAADYDQALDKCTAVRVAMVGAMDVGKTWLINKLCGGHYKNALPCASGDDGYTQSLSVKVLNLESVGGHDGRQCVFLDTAGLNSPTRSVAAMGHMLGAANGDPMKAMRDMLDEVKRQENFVRQVAFEFAQVYVFVVGQMSLQDQEDILQLMQQAEQCSVRKQVIVVHNLRRMSYSELVSNMYLQTMQNVFKLAKCTHVLSPTQPRVDELYSALRDSDRAVHVRHVFLTQEEHGADDRSNEAVLAYLRKLITSCTPASGNILDAIAKVATDCAKSMVRLPLGKNIEIRFHRGRGVLLGGEVTEAEAKQMAEWAKRPPKSDEVAKTEAKLFENKLISECGPLTDEERAEMEAANGILHDALVRAMCNEIKPVFGAETLVPLRNPQLGITCLPVWRQATLDMKQDSDVKYNVSRVRAMAMGQPHWMVCMHFAIPGLEPGELKRLRETLRWGEGLTMDAATPGANDTLKLEFTVSLVNSPRKQVYSLNRAGAPVWTADRRTLGGAIRIDATQAPVVVEAGNRPFPAPTTTLRLAKESSGTYALDILVQTKVENCSWEIEPILSYGRGVLTVMVCAEPSEDDCEAPENQAWISGDYEAPEFKVLAGADGSDEDLHE